MEEIRRKALALVQNWFHDSARHPLWPRHRTQASPSRADLVEFGPSFSLIRRVRSEEELIYRPQRFLTDLACIALEQRLHPGMNEQEILGVIYDAYLKHGGDPGIHFIASTRWTSPTGLSLGSAQPKESWRLAAWLLTVSYWGYSTQIHRAFAGGASARCSIVSSLMSL